MQTLLHTRPQFAVWARARWVTLSLEAMLCMQSYRQPPTMITLRQRQALPRLVSVSLLMFSTLGKFLSPRQHSELQHLIERTVQKSKLDAHVLQNGLQELTRRSLQENVVR